MRTSFTILLFALLSFVSVSAFAGALTARNPPSACTAPNNECLCSSGKGAQNKCIKVAIDMGVTTPWTGSAPCALKVFADDQSPMVFTPDALYAVCGYTFKRLGNAVLSDGVTPAEVVLAHPNGESVRFVFTDGESLGRPDPGFHIPMDERLMMVDAQGWACTGDPVYYDLYETDGTVRRFLATDQMSARGRLVSVTDSRGVVTTAADMGIDVIYGPDGVRQFLTPSRLADVRVFRGGYAVTVYPVQEPPTKDPATGLYPLPDSAPVERVSIESEADGRKAIVTLRSGEGDPKRYVYEYVRNDWSMTRPSGVEERQDRTIEDSRCARTVKEIYSPSKELLSRDEYNYVWEDWGFAATNHVDGFGGTTRTTSWEYYTAGNGKGQIKTEIHQSGLKIEYTYDANNRVVSTKRSGPDMMTEVTTYSYTSVDPADIVPPVDTRPRTVIKTLDGIECERIYYVYSPLTNIVERVGTQGAAYDSTNAFRTITAFYPTEVGAAGSAARVGKIKSIRREDGRLDLYDYDLADGLWTETVTHLHEQSPAPVSGKTTRDITVINRHGETVERKTEAFIDGSWYTIARDCMTYNTTGKRIRTENLAGQETVFDWDCCHKVSETQPDGSTTTWDYDDEDRVIASSRLIPLDMTNVTWLTTCYRYDALGRQTATWQTNFAAQVGLPATRTRYDQLGRVTSRFVPGYGLSETSYSANGLVVTNTAPNGALTVTRRNSDGSTLSITGTAVTPEFYSRGVLADGTRWTKTVQGETDASPRFTKRYENMLGQVIKEERSGFKGAVLATAHSYDSFGRLVTTIADYEPTVEYTYDALGNRVATIRSADNQWRKNETTSSFVLDDAIVWLTQTNIVSCSDSAIAPLFTSSARQLTGLTAALPSRSRSTDIRSNVAVHEALVDSALVTSRQTLPYATNKPLAISSYGVPLMDVSVSAVTNTVTYDALGRQITNTDGRGNTRHTEYNSFGQRVASIDALGNRITYTYDPFGNLASVTDPLGNATVYEYDLRGQKTYEGGATYPVRYTYDIFGNKTTMMTYRDESLGPNSGDVTTWLYDIASGCMTNKVYADGKGPKYNYTPDGKLSQRTWARGIVTDYAYDGWNNLTNTVYSDDTPTVSRFYDAMGRQTAAHDAAGVTTFIYDSLGSLTNETVIGVAGINTIERFWDEYGRTVGYALNGTRQTTIGYDPATARIESMLANGSDTPFTWSYLPGTDLKYSLSYPNGLTVSWQYDAKGQLLQVCNATPTNIISQYDYTYDAAGRRVARDHSGYAFDHADHIDYGYNVRSELTNAVSAVDSDYRYAYKFDDIGNRETAFERGTNSVYTANNLNQYTSISNFASSASFAAEFTPQFDDDGNQTLIKTSTGIWEVQYNAENRPIEWSNGVINITMKFDRMGRRVEYVEIVGSGDETITNVHHRFVYDNYLCLERLDASANNAIDLIFAWDSTEANATRPLMIEKPGNCKLQVTHDGNKNVSELVFFSGGIGVAAHYDYVPFGALIASTCNTTSTDYDFRANNPFRFSSEYSDCVLGLVYYNFRHYIQGAGCWLMRDPVADKGFERVFNDIFPCPQNKSACGEYSFVNNCSISEVDRLGLVCICCFKGRTGKLRVDDSCKGKLRIWIIDEDNGKPSAAVAGQEVSADGFAVNGTMYKVDGSTCVTLKCSTTTISAETCVNNLAYIVGKKEPREVPWDTFGGGKTPNKEDVAPLVK